MEKLAEPVLRENKPAYKTLRLIWAISISNAF